MLTHGTHLLLNSRVFPKPSGIWLEWYLKKFLLLEGLDVLDMSMHCWETLQGMAFLCLWSRMRRGRRIQLEQGSHFPRVQPALMPGLGVEAAPVT